MKFVASLTAVLLPACALANDDDGGTDLEQDATSTAYVDIVDFAKIDQGQWFDGIRRLNDGFAAQPGAYAHLVPLTFGCSVTSKLGNVKDCAWTFGAANADVDPATAAIAVDAPTFQCHVAMKTTATRLASFLATSSDPLHAPLFGAASISDQIAGCFDHPIGGTPSTLGTGATYVAARNYYTTAANQARWTAATAALEDGFDRVCGDTFCGGDMSDLQSLVFECAITKSTGNIKSCAWVFAGSFHLVAAKGGTLDLTSKSFTCPVAVKGTLPALIDTLTVAGTEDAIRRPLPGVTTTAYDGLLGCLP